MANVLDFFTRKDGLTLVLGATGKTGRRVVQRLEEQGVKLRLGSRSADPAFEWNDDSNWPDVLKGVEAVYINYAPDLAVPDALPSIERFVRHAKAAKVKRLVLLSGRGEEEAQACEAIVQASGLEWTIVRASWFNQNFSEAAFRDMVLAGQITLPAGEVLEPYVDADDIADVIAVSLSGGRHVGQVYEVTGPRLMTVADIATDLSNATGRNIQYIPITHDQFIDGFKQSGASADMIWLMDYLFQTVLDGRNSQICDGVQRALGRPAKDFIEFANDVAQSGVWSPETEEA